jgi:hypothetical protein
LRNAIEVERGLASSIVDAHLCGRVQGDHFYFAFLSRSEVSSRERSVITHLVVPIGDLPVGAGSSNAVGCANAALTTLRTINAATHVDPMQYGLSACWPDGLSV